MTTLERKEAKQLLNIMREKRSWDAVYKELKALAKGGEITDDLIRSYIKKEWSGGIIRRAGRRIKLGFRDFFGNALTPFSRNKYQAQTGAELFNELRITTDFEVMKKVGKTLIALKSPLGQERMATEIMFHIMTSFSKRSQKLLLKLVKKPGGWKKLFDNVDKVRREMISVRRERVVRYLKQKRGVRAKDKLRGKKEEVLGRFDETEAILEGIARTIPQFRRALAYGPNFRLLEAAAYLYLIPKASQKPLEMLMKYIEKKMDIKAKELEKKKLILELTEVERVMRSKPRRAQ
jgi:hypothetical protein